MIGQRLDKVARDQLNRGSQGTTIQKGRRAGNSPPRSVLAEAERGWGAGRRSHVEVTCSAAERSESPSGLVTVRSPLANVGCSTGSVKRPLWLEIYLFVFKIIRCVKNEFGASGLLS